MNYLETAKQCQQMLTSDPENPEVQKQVFVQFRNQFDENMAGRNKRMLEGKELDEYLHVAGTCLKMLQSRLFSA